MSDHEPVIVPLYAMDCRCDPDAPDYEDEHGQDAFGEGVYCRRTPTDTACQVCSEEWDSWTGHIEPEADDDEREPGGLR